jgi:hypothetical protein
VAFGGVGSLTCKRRARCCFLPREYGAPSTLHIISVPASRRHTHTHPHVLSSRKPYLIRPLWVVFHLLLVSVFFGSHSSTRYKTFSIIFLSRGRCTATTTRLGGGGAGMGRRGTGSGGRKDRRVMTRVGIYILYHGFTKSRRKQKNTPLFFFHFTLRARQSVPLARRSCEPHVSEVALGLNTVARPARTRSCSCSCDARNACDACDALDTDISRQRPCLGNFRHASRTVHRVRSRRPPP